jgi:DNA modification methylase
LEWVGVRRIRVKSAIEPVLWFSKTAHPKADNRRVLRPYAKRMQEILAAGGEPKRARPAGHAFGDGSFARDNGGAIPDELLTASMAASQTKYLRACRARGLPIHPARMPEIIPDFAIRLTTEPGDLVYDPFGGSGTTAEVAERLGRSWILTERSLRYLQGAALRFPALDASPPAAR